MKKAISSILVMLMVLVTIITSNMPVKAAATYYTAPNGLDTNSGTINSPWTLQKAVDVAVAGDMVIARGGSYTTGFYINGKNGTSASHITIQNYSDETPVLKSTYIRINSSSYIDVSGFEVTGSHPRTWDWGGIALTDCTNITVLDCYVHDTDYYGGIVLQRTSNSKVKNCTASYGGIGITIRENSNYNIIEGCTAKYNDLWRGNSDGIDISYLGGDGDSHHNAIIGCTAYNNSDDGIDTWISNYNLIAGCTSYRNGYNRAGRSSGDGQGFKLGGIGTNNNNGGYVLAINNVSFNNKANGMDQNGGSMPVYMYNNTVYNNGNKGITKTLDGIIYVRNNISYNNAAGNIEAPSSIVILSNNFTLNPNFVNTTYDDYHLQSSSFAINTGMTLNTLDLDSGFTTGQPQYWTDLISYWLSHDKDGLARPVDLVYEPGAFEYSAATTPLPSPTPTPTPTPRGHKG